MLGNSEICSGLKTLDLSSWDLSRVSSFRYLFYGCSGLTSINVNTNTSGCGTMEGMFGYCSSLTEIDISSFNMSNVANISKMFYGCSSLRKIYASSDLDIAKVSSSSSVFYNTRSLVGGAGTTWNSSIASDKAYFKVDGGVDSPGLFTAKV